MITQNSGLIQHQRIHTGEKHYECYHYGKPSVCAQPSLCIKVHNMEKPNTCSKYNKAFSVRGHLIVHQRVHNGEKPCDCRDCGKAFHGSSALLRHQRTHMEEKPCKCGKAFDVNSVLISHQRVHSGEKPHECGECGKAFSQIHTESSPENSYWRKTLRVWWMWESFPRMLWSYQTPERTCQKKMSTVVHLGKLF